MRPLTLIAFFLYLSGHALACPVLTGTYLCGENENSEEVKVAQEEIEGITIYSVTSDEGPDHSPANNYAYKFINAESGMTGTIRYVCEGNAFNTYSDIQIVSEGQIVKSLQTIESLSLGPNKELVRTVTGENLEGGSIESIAQTMTCIRK